MHHSYSSSWSSTHLGGCREGPPALLAPPAPRNKPPDTSLIHQPHRAHQAMEQASLPSLLRVASVKAQGGTSSSLEFVTPPKGQLSSQTVAVTGISAQLSVMRPSDRALQRAGTPRHVINFAQTCITPHFRTHTEHVCGALQTQDTQILHTHTFYILVLLML